MKKWFTGKSDSKEQKEQDTNTKEDNSIDPNALDYLANDPEEKELEAQGFDPVVALNDLKDRVDEAVPFTDYVGYLEVGMEEILKIMMQLEYSNGGGEVRHEEAHPKGGRICSDQRVVQKSRSAGKEVIKAIGKKILSGSFNLTQVSFPIRVMIPKSALETSVHATTIFPLFVSKAAYTPDPLERFKLVITAIVSSFFLTNTFLKPLNPILGETLEATYNDGTQVYVEQISHHPPISYFLVIGPNRIYRYWGYYKVEGRAWLNSLEVPQNNHYIYYQIFSKGMRVIQFKDGQRIDFNFPNEIYRSTFLGQLRQETIGKLVFQDTENQLRCEIEFGKIKKLPSDYFKADIMREGQRVSTVMGSYLGYIDFENGRYWDYRTLKPYKIQMKPNCLESDHRLRKDLRTLSEGNVVQAQIEKEKMEVSQRNDQKLRESYTKKKKQQ